MIFLPDEGGILITGDFTQNGRKAPPHTSVLVNPQLPPPPTIGFNTGILTTPAPFFKFYGKNEDVHGQNVPALLEMEFDMIIPSHGPTMKGGAKEDLKKGWGQAKKSDMWKSP